MYHPGEKLRDLIQAEEAAMVATTVEDLRSTILAICAIIKDDLQEIVATTDAMFSSKP